MTRPEPAHAQDRRADDAGLRSRVATATPASTPNPDATKFTLDMTLPAMFNAADAEQASAIPFAAACSLPVAWLRCSASTTSSPSPGSPAPTGSRSSPRCRPPPRHTCDARRQLHPNVEPLGFLLGTWTGRGHGVYPTIESFDYDETITFAHVGKPFLAYSQRTTAADDGRPLHAESGYWRMPQPASSNSCSPIPPASSRSRRARSTWKPTEPSDRSACARRRCRGPRPRRRSWPSSETSAVDGDVMRYEVRMAAVGQPLQLHLSAMLHRQTVNAPPPPPPPRRDRGAFVRG